MNEIKSLSDTLGVKPRVFSLENVLEYQKALENNEVALNYLKIERGFTEETIKHFRLGYKEEENSIVIPLFKRGEVVGIKYRKLDGEERYASHKGSQNWIYNEDGVDFAKKRGFVVIVEGEFDLMSCYQAGIRNVVSPASGKDSYGVWIELLDSIPKILIAYDNDDGGKGASVKMADRLGNDKCFEVTYPDGVKDANEYFKRFTLDDFKALAKTSKPFYKYDYKGLSDIITSLRQNREEPLIVRAIPNVKFEKDWICVLSGVSNAGKTSFAMNVASEFVSKGVPTLVMPFERGIEQVGKRFLQVFADKTQDEFSYMDNSEWEKFLKDVVDVPIYFSMPKKDQIVNSIVKSKRLFDTRVVIIDHLDYIIRNVSGKRDEEIANTLQALKRVAEENKILLIIVSHVRKVESQSGMLKRKPTMEDLKGSSSLYQDPEVVVMITRPEDKIVEVDILKNKGEMKGGQFHFNPHTGKLGDRVDEFDLILNAEKIKENADKNIGKI